MKRRTTAARSSKKGTPSPSSRRSPAADAAALAKAQKKAAELVLEDESWRRGLTDDEASRLLEEALKRSDEALARAAQAGRLTGDSAYDAADEAKRILTERTRAAT